MPIGHVSLSSASDRLIADVAKDRVERFPGFDKDEFKTMSEADLKRVDEPTIAVCCPDVSAVDVAGWEATHYAYPTWWQADYYRPDRADRAAINVAGANLNSANPRATPPTTNERARERVMASERTDDNSPHFDGRAQPGDVLGVETGGERTYVGDTSEDENKRRKDAEEAATKRK